MFDNLDEIAWEKLGQAHGNAQHVPAALRGLISKNDKTRKNSYWLLDNYVVLQSSLYEAALFVVPFLLEIISSDTKYGKDLAYELLFEIANGWAPPEITCVDSDGKVVPLEYGCKEAVIRGLDVYLAEIKNQNSKFRRNALELLLSLQEVYEFIKGELETTLVLVDKDFYPEMKKFMAEWE